MPVIAIASDHAGFALKTHLAEQIRGLGHKLVDLGPFSEASVDYPEFANALAAALKDGRAELGVLICGSGIGISIAANRHPHIRAALCSDSTSARLSRAHNDANVLALGARLIGLEVARDCLHAFLATPFEGGRHAGRVAKLGGPS
ncbi:MAG: ribose 5-phosphate isomerase B [Sphingomonadaceae bacterium]|nr:ribose 5-phosphate isomerase B [Sphingomonadaceae bacterium]